MRISHFLVALSVFAVSFAAHAGTITGSYPSTVNNVAIPDFTCADTTSGAGGLTNSITIPAGDTGAILDVTVQLQVTHTWRGDIQASISDGTTTTTLALDDDGSGDNYFAIFDSAAPMLCSDATLCGLTGIGPCSTAPGPTCQPASSLVPFNGAEAASRTFTLSICDDAGADTGTLDSWTLNVEREGPTGVPLAPAIDLPSLGTSAMIGLGALLAMVGFFGLRRRRMN